MNDKTKELLEKLEEGVKGVFDSDRYKDYLMFVSKFYRYSYFNTMLIFSQKKTATLVAGYKKWQEMGRFVKKGEKGIAILAPGFKNKDYYQADEKGRLFKDEKGNPVLKETKKELAYFMPVHVFDISQTDGEPVPTLAPVLQGEIDNYDKVFGALEKLSPCSIVFEDLPYGVRGEWDYEAGTITLSTDLSQTHTIKTLVHELAHARLHTQIMNEKRSEQVMKQSEREIEAESIAFVVSNHLGIDTSDYSFGYIASWSKDKKVEQLKAVLSTIAKESSAILKEIDLAVSREPEKTYAIDR